MRLAKVDATVLENYEAGDWATEGWKLDPAADTVLADTDQLTYGLYDFLIIWNASAAGPRTLRIQHRNAANTATLHDQLVGQGDNPPESLNIRSYLMGGLERMRVILRADFTGGIQASIIWTRRS